MKTYTKEEKREYHKGLRAQWADVKSQLTGGKIKEIQAVMSQNGMNFSVVSYMLTLISMEQNGYDGIPYLDCKTFNGWKGTGFSVKRGEHSNIDGMTWIKAEPKEGQGEDDGFLFPKVYRLFHRSQVEPSEN